MKESLLTKRKERKKEVKKKSWEIVTTKTFRAGLHFSTNLKLKIIDEKRLNGSRVFEKTSL